ncbi:MAG: D-lyxose/D-mannose family sugar isomerase [Bacteroidetes bacterium]|nr:D-lyxose/D-mannose family sugar isomerase [Bacteroidota bacterium]
MITHQEYSEIMSKVFQYLNNAKIGLTSKEESELEIADFGLGRINEFGLQVVTYINTKRCCSKELILFPQQICPEHRHPEIGGELGKEETFRCRFGKVYLYVSGDPSSQIQARIPDDKKDCFTVFNEIELNPGDQYTLNPDTLHWFQAGSAGAIVSEFSTTSYDDFDIWTDPLIKRTPIVL